MRSANNTSNFRNVNNNGNDNNNNANNTNGVALGFGLGVKVIIKTKSAHSEGANDLPFMVNNRHDTYRRTLLAWIQMTLMYFHGYMLSRLDCVSILRLIRDEFGNE